MYKGYFFSLFLLLLMSCSSAEKKHDDKMIFRYNEYAGINSLDPAFSRNQAIIWACNQLYNGLVQLDSNLNVQPALAKKWTISEDGKSYTFHLRDDVFFHQHELFPDKASRKLRALDVKYSLNRLRSSALAAPGAWVLKEVSHIDTPDELTVVIHLKESFPPFLGLLSMNYCGVLPAYLLEHKDYDFRSHPVGTGPFHFQYWKENVKLVFRKNPIYFEKEDGAQLPFLDAVSISFIPDRQSAFLEFLKGKHHFLSGLDASYKDELLNYSGELRDKYQDKLNMISQAYLNTEYLGILQGDEQANVGLRNKKVRQAINCAFDREEMVKYLRNNIGRAATAGFIPEGLPAFVDTVYNAYNPERALQLLKEAGYPNGKGLPEIVISTSSDYLDFCEYIQGSLSAIGIVAAVDVGPPSTLRKQMSASQLSFFRGSWIADYADAENYLSLFYSENFCPGGPNYTHFKNHTYDSLYRIAIAETDLNRRLSLYRRMDAMIMDEAVIIPLYYDRVLRFTHKNVEGLGSNGLNLLDLKRTKLKN